MEIVHTPNLQPIPICTFGLSGVVPPRSCASGSVKRTHTLVCTCTESTEWQGVGITSVGDSLGAVFLKQGPFCA